MDFQLIVILAFLACFIAMKALALFASPQADLGFLIRTPVFAPPSEKRAVHKTQASVKRLKRRFLFLVAANILLIEFYQYLFSAKEFAPLLKAWLFAPYLYFFTNLLGVSAQCLGLLTREIPADLHNHPYLAKSLSEFWGQRWNMWVGDWLALVGKKLAGDSRARKFFWAFLLSGVFHEIILALPFYLATGNNVFGLMTLFFMIQFLLVGVDKLVLAKRQWGWQRRLFLWVGLVVPLPLFVNASVLSFFGFWP